MASFVQVKQQDFCAVSVIKKNECSTHFGEETYVPGDEMEFWMGF